MTRILVAAALALLAMVPAARATTYVCDLEPYTIYGWIPPKVVLIVSEDGSRALVYDGNVARVYGEPIPASVKKRSKSSLQFAWKIKNLPTDRKTEKVNADYTAVLNLATMKMTMRVFTQANDFSPHGGGTCAIQK